MLLAAVNFENRLLWACMIGWIISVILHEFAHGLVAMLGGDYTIRERGGLSLNPLQYVDPVNSLIIPIAIFAMGGIPLPGGVTYVRRDLLRGRGWDTAVSLAGPAMNLLLFFVCAVPLHPHFGWVDPLADPSTWSNFQVFLGAMALLQFMAMVLNLIPVPPLDGFQAIAPWLPNDFREKVSTPPVSTFLLIGYFLVLWQGHFFGVVLTGAVRLLETMKFGDDGIGFFIEAYQRALFGR